jgi:hypothetical protein
MVCADLLARGKHARQVGDGTIHAFKQGGVGKTVIGEIGFDRIDRGRQRECVEKPKSGRN